MRARRGITGRYIERLDLVKKGLRLLFSDSGSCVMWMGFIPNDSIDTIAEMASYFAARCKAILIDADKY
jgi:hypothetical protein